MIKEFTLARHPTSMLFILLSSMLLIPNYPYFVIFFYNCLGIFFICLTGRENKDINYTMLLPVQKKAIVKARILMAAALEVAQIIVAAPFILLRGSLIPAGNAVGLDANTTLLGMGFVFFGIFNFTFFTGYYKDVNKVGMSFLLGSIATTVFMLIVETAVHIVPFARDVLDMKDPKYMGSKLVVLLIGILCFAGLTLLAGKKSVRSFEKLDL